jgi:glyoxylase-like metal-dependent hydrolase (beta-lactamase superfamily II)
MRGQKIKDIRAILLTHADVMLDANAGEIRDISGAQVYINRLDAPRLELRYPHTPRHAIRASAEKKRARKIGYVPCPVDFYIAEGDILDLWYGLTVLALPGPTPGHCGFYCRHLGAVFCGGLLEERTRTSRFFNIPPFDIEAQARSMLRVRAMKAQWTLRSVD